MEQQPTKVTELDAVNPAPGIHLLAVQDGAAARVDLDQILEMIPADILAEVEGARLEVVQAAQATEAARQEVEDSVAGLVADRATITALALDVASSREVVSQDRAQVAADRTAAEEAAAAAAALVGPGGITAEHVGFSLDEVPAPVEDVAMGGRKLTGLADAVEADDAATWGQIGFNLGITREQIATRAIPVNSFIVTGESAAGDIGAGAVYVRGTAGGRRPIQDALGVWWNLSLGSVAQDGWLGAMGDNVADDAAPLADLCAWAAADPKRRAVRITGRCYSATDIPALHTVQALGNGSIRVGTGPEFFVAPNDRNRGYGGLGINNLYVDPIFGDDEASGLAPEFAFRTPQTAFNKVLFKYGSPLQGYWQLNLAKGVYRTAVNTWNMDVLRSRPLEIRGPDVGVWDNSAPAPEPQIITAITAANPPVVSSAGHGLSAGTEVFIYNARKASGAHEGDGAIYTIANVTTDTYELAGVDGSAWSAYVASSGKAWPMIGTNPRAIFYGTGNGSGWGINSDGADNIAVYNLVGFAWGTQAGKGDEGFVRGADFSILRTNNVHAYDCSKGVEPRDNSRGYVIGGRFLDNYVGLKSIHARYTFGAANPGSAALTSTPIVARNSIGIDIWEMSSGHADGLILKDNATDLLVRKNAHCVAVYNRYINTGPARAAIVLEPGCHLNLGEGTSIWEGAFDPRVRRLAYSWLDTTERHRSWLTVARGQNVAWAGGAGEQIVHQITIPQQCMTENGDGLRSRLSFSGTWTNGNVLVRYKLDGVTFHTVTLAADAAAREIMLDYACCNNGFGSLRGTRRLETRTGTSTFVSQNQMVFATLSNDAGPVIFSVTAEVVHASDSISAFGSHELETIGL